MTLLTVLLSRRKTTQSALRKVLCNLLGNKHLHIPEPAAAPSEIEMTEFLVSEAMKLVCYSNTRVLILDVQKNDTVEKGISCRRFNSLIEFIPSAKALSHLLNSSRSWEVTHELPCEMTCTVFGSRCDPRNSYGNLYSGKVIFKICHQLAKRNIEKMSSAMPLVRILRSNQLFIPAHGRQKALVDSFLDEIETLYQLGSKDDFKKATSSILRKTLYKEFPYFYGDEW